MAAAAAHRHAAQTGSSLLLTIARVTSCNKGCNSCPPCLLLCHLLQLLAKDHLQAVVAFHKWRHAVLRSVCKQKVQEALEEFAEEEQHYKQVQAQHDALQQK